MTASHCTREVISLMLRVHRTVMYLCVYICDGTVLFFLAGLLNSAYDTATNTASSVVSGSAKMVQNTAEFVGAQAEKFTKK